MAGDYQDRHRYFLQAIMVQRLVTERKAQDIYQRACQLYNGDYKAEDLMPCILLINEQLKPLSMEIRHGKSEDNGIKYFGLVNTFEDEHSKMATDFSANEISLFKKVLESILMSNDGHVSSMLSINLGSGLPIKINPTTAEALLANWVNEKWLTEVDGNISLGPRTIIELGVYLKKIYTDDIPDCKLCMDIVVKGQTCENCGVRLHLYCSSIYFKGRPQNTRKCPGCQANWLHEIPSMTHT